MIFFLFIQGEEPNKLGLVVSLGTGNKPVGEINNISVYIPQSVTDLYKAAENLQAAANFGSIMVDLVRSLFSSFFGVNVEGWNGMVWMKKHSFSEGVCFS